MLYFKNLNFKKILKELAIGLLILFVVSNLLSYLRKPSLESNKLPKMAVTLLSNTYFSTAEEKGKPIVIHFWATWCPTCKLEAANIQSVSEQYTVLTIAVQSGDDSKLEAYMRDKSLDFNVLNDSDGSWSKKFKVEAFPTTFIYDGKGELQFTEVGYTTTAGLLARLKLIE
ncbi:MAG: protein disulfide oxidoreductase [Campylobacterota bacterium]|nr:protein disulfide oxidoreductase [Campylobacterota bacterium]